MCIQADARSPPKLQAFCIIDLSHNVPIHFVTKRLECPDVDCSKLYTASSSLEATMVKEAGKVELCQSNWPSRKASTLTADCHSPEIRLQGSKCSLQQARSLAGQTTWGRPQRRLTCVSSLSQRREDYPGSYPRILAPVKDTCRHHTIVADRTVPLTVSNLLSL